MSRRISLIVSSVLALAVSAAAGAQGGLTLQGHQPGTVPQLELGGRTSGTLGSQGHISPKDGSDVELYEYHSPGGEAVRFRVGSNDFDTWLALYGPNGDFIEHNDDAWLDTVEGWRYQSVIEAHLADNGTYTVVVSSYRPNAGSFEVWVETDQSAAEQLERLDQVATELVLPAAEKFELRQGQVAAPELYTEPSALFRFELAEEALVRIHAEAADVDTVLALFDASLTQRAWNDDWYGGNSNNWESLINELLGPGTYYLIAGGYWSSSEGLVTLEVTTQTLEAAPDQQLNVPQTVEVFLSSAMPPAGPYSGPGQLFSFTLAEPQVVQLRAESAEVDTVLVLYDEQMNQLADNDDWHGGDSNAWQSLITQQLQPGTYHVIVGAYWAGSSGPVLLELSQVDVVAEGGAELSIPSSVEVYLDEHLPTVGEYFGPGQTFGFTLDSDAVVVIHAESAEVDTVLVLADENMNMITHNDDWLGARDNNWHSRIAQPLEAGTYHVIAGGYWASSQGLLSLSIDYGDDSQVHNWDSAPALSVPQQLVVQLEEDMPSAGGSFSGPGRAFRLHVPRDMELQLSAASASGSPRHIDAVLLLYDTNLQLITSNDDNHGDWSDVSGRSRITRSVEAGDYFVVVGSYFMRSGSVELIVEEVAD